MPAPSSDAFNRSPDSRSLNHVYALRASFLLLLIICYSQQSHGRLVYRQCPGRRVRPSVPLPLSPYWPFRLACIRVPDLTPTPASAQQCEYSSPRCPRAQRKPSPKPRAPGSPAPTRAHYRTRNSSSTSTAASMTLRRQRASTTSSRTRGPCTVRGWASPVSGFSRASSELLWGSDGRPLARPRRHLQLLTGTCARRFRVRKKRSTRAAGATSILREPKSRIYVLR
jgi:hypothetical protein